MVNMPLFSGLRSSKKSPSPNPSSGSGSSLLRAANTFRGYLRNRDPIENGKKRKPVTRSDTFTMKASSKESDDEYVNYHTYTKKKGSSNVETDVFGALYEKQLSKSPENVPYNGNSRMKKSSKFPILDKWRQQEQKDDEHKKIMFMKHRLSFDEPDSNVENTPQKPFNENPINYATFSKRRFRPDFVPNDNRSLVWFVNMENQEEKTPEECVRKKVSRNETFRVGKIHERPRLEMPPDEEDSISSEASAKITQKYLSEPIRVEIKNPDRGTKIVPVGVATPYTADTIPKPRGVIVRPRIDPIRIEIGSQDPQPWRSSFSHVRSRPTGRLSSFSRASLDPPPRSTYQFGDHVNPKEKPPRFRPSGLEDVMKAVRQPSAFRAAPLEPKPVVMRFPTTMAPKVKRPVWR
ncbi:uncharacterized protein LOC129791709 [Lutzomyia longipalpis]|uniref:uncharacterized protein LOC129791709 n=1 Tax=Lutzomyia longipalpis TaxID=7200 RepID=UPI0024837C0F|nr:uncharacterized protein LOC129791709 [Lutzomyia longipalpis]XP_055685985.1 uncharacterized protein LOC129791709 [Lutzomyia longipalpis]XP_055685986.1 uncharacterized protein LOC129791709 [Lutzomyia longipalpis]